MDFRKIYGGIVWFVATLFVVYSFCLNTAAAVFADAIKAGLHAGNFGVAFATGAFILGFACMQIPAGYLLDRYNARWIVSLGILLLVLGNVAISFSNHLILFTLSNFLQGIGASFAFIAAGVLISQWFPGKIFPILFGLTQTISCISAGIIHYWFMLELNAQSWNSIYQKLAIFGLVLLIITLAIVKTPKDYVRETGYSIKEAVGRVLENKQIVLAAVAAATSFGVLLAYASFWYFTVQHYYVVDNLQAVIIGGMIFLGIGLGTPILGWLSNHYQSRKMIIHVSLAAGVMTLLLGIYLPHYDINTLIIAKIISFFIGFFLSGSMLFYTVVSENSTNAIRGVALSVTNTAVFLMNTMMLFLPYLFVTTISTDFFTYLWILPFVVMVSIMINYFIEETYSDIEF